MQGMRERLGRGSSVSNSPSGAGFCGTDEILLGVVHQQDFGTALARARNVELEKIARVEDMIQVQKKMRSDRVEELNARMRLFDAKTSSALAQCKLGRIAFDRTLRQQLDTASRRLQELVFETLGETEKMIDKVNRHRDFRSSECEEKREQTLDSLRWKLFLERLSSDSLGNLVLQDITKANDPKAFERLVAWCGRGREGDENLVDVNSVRRFATVNYNIKKSPAAENSVVKPSRVACSVSGSTGKHRRPPAVASEPEDAHSALSLLYGDSGICLTEPTSETDSEHPRSPTSLVSFHRRLPKSSRKLPLYEPELLASSQLICWLLWPQFGRSPATAQVYFCLEERCKQPATLIHAVSAVKTLGEIYLGKSCVEMNDKAQGTALQQQAQRPRFDAAILAKEMEKCQDSTVWPQGPQVIRAEGRHRQHYCLAQLGSSQVGDLIRRMPDVLVAQGEPGSTHHFVPATVLQVLETVRFMELNSRVFSAQDRTALRERYKDFGPTHNALTTLYVAMPSEPGQVSALGGLGGRAVCTDQLQMVPIPAQALDELIGCYLVRSATLSNTCKSLLETQNQHAVLFPAHLDSIVKGESVPSAAAAATLAVGQQRSNPQSGSQKRDYSHAGKSRSARAAGSLRRPAPSSCQPQPAHAAQGTSDQQDQPQSLLVCAIRSESGTAADPTRVASAAAAAEAVLTASCLWRACNARSVPGDGAGLCAYHQTIHGLLAKHDEGAEIKRHLPRQTVQALSRRGAGDVSALVKSSSLVSELLSSKLGSTVSGFCARAALAARQKPSDGDNGQVEGEGGSKSKKRREAKVCSNPQDRLKEAQLRKATLEVEESIAVKVDAAECAVVKELQRFAQLGVFPSEELVKIRDEFRALNEEREALFASTLPTEAEDDGTSTATGSIGSPGTLKPRDNPLFKSRAVFLDREFARLIDESGATLPLQPSVNNNTENGDECGGPLRRERHIIEAELELEFCLRKVAILRKKRISIEDSVNSTPPLIAPPPAQLYPTQHKKVKAATAASLPLSSSNTGSSSSSKSKGGKRWGR